MSRLTLMLLVVTAGFSPDLCVAAGSSTIAADRTVRVAASKRYQKGRIHQFLFGGGYRELWKAEIELPVLDLAREGNGLTPTGRFGGLQTAVLAFKGNDGRSYSFRGTDKDPSAVLPSILKDTFFRGLVQDQMAAQHPGGPVAAAVISESAGVLTIHERLVVMPDDPALGDFQQEFAGMVGSFYEYPLPVSDNNPGFHGATEIINQKKLYERLSQSNEEPVEREAFLRARLVDILLGDFDRHRKQWRWAKIPGKTKWQPIPEDRDQAFVRYDGAGTRLAYIYVPILQCYGPEFPRISGLTLHGWEQDRWLLAGLEWSRWLEVVADIQKRLSDEAIDHAVAALPPEYAQLDGDRLRHDVRARRDHLREGAREFYEHLSAQIDVQTSSAADRVLLEWAPSGDLYVGVRDLKTATVSEDWFSRSFKPEETEEVRVYLRGGDDKIIVRGDPGSITLRVIAGDGKKTLDDSAGGGVTLYDQRLSVKMSPGDRTSLVAEKYELPPSDAGFVDVENVPPREWGSETLPLPAFGYEKDVGFVLGLGFTHTVYGFRKHPWASRYQVSGAFATEAKEPIIKAVATLRPENSPLLIGVDARYSGIEIVRFYGIGNETSSDGPDRLFRVRNRQAKLAVTLGRNFFDDALLLSGGLWGQFSLTEPGDRLIDQLDPFGAGGFGAIGGIINFAIDTRKSIEEEGALVLPMHPNPAAGYPTSGFSLITRARISPPLIDATEVYGSIDGSIAGHFSFFDKGRLALSLRAGGAVTFGEVPYFAAAYIGGGQAFSGDTTVRGLRAQRFAGDASLFGNADVRLFIASFKLGIPMDFGIFGFGDVGRVFADEESTRWHPSAGGGIWFAPLARTNTISTSVAVSEESVLFYFRAGFHY